MGICVTWRIVAASSVGTSHVTAGKECEDSCLALVEPAGLHPETLTIFVADGAGSASHALAGAELAVEAASAYIKQALGHADFSLTEALAVDCVQAVRESLIARAETKELTPRDFACTFLGLLSNDQGTLVMQVGDGGIVVDVGEGLVVPIAPMGGEYANMTTFVTEASAIDQLATRFYPGKAQRAAVFSDGLQRLALNLAANSVHEPFFKPFFRTLATATASQEEELAPALARFLASEAVNERTDDDKTLVVAVLVDEENRKPA